MEKIEMTEDEELEAILNTPLPSHFDIPMPI